MKDQFQIDRGRVNSVVASPDERWFASASSNGNISIRHTAGSDSHIVLHGHSCSVCEIVAAPDSRYLLSGGTDGTVKIWDVADGVCKTTLSGHAGAVNCLAISKNGMNIFSGGADGDIRVWNFESGECLRILEKHQSWWDRDGRNSLISSSNVEFSYHDVLGNLAYANTRNRNDGKFSGHADPVTSLSLSPNGRYLISASTDNTVRLWNVSDAQCLWLFGGSGGGSRFSVRRVLVTPDSRYVLALSDRLRVWKLTSKTIRRFFWEVADERPVIEFKRPCGELLDAAMTPCGKRVVTIEKGGKCLGIYTRKTGMLLHIIDDLPGKISCISTAPGGSFIIAGTNEGKVKILDFPFGYG